MTRIFVTGSADGLGKMAAELLIEQGHLIAALAHDVEEQHAPLPGVDHVLHGLGDQARHGSAR